MGLVVGRIKEPATIPHTILATQEKRGHFYYLKMSFMLTKRLSGIQKKLQKGPLDLFLSDGKRYFKAALM